MNDDFNTPEALAVMFALSKEINRKLNAGEDAATEAAQLVSMSELLGIVQQSAESWFHSGDEDSSWIEALIIERNEARKSRDFARADAIRDELAGKGIVLEDGPDGTGWKRVG